jgi:hypoxia up-regulated 1
MDDQDRRRRERDESRNNLESFIFNVRDKLDQSTFKHHSTEQERETLNTKLMEVSEWLYDDGELPSTTTEQYRSKLAEIKTPYGPIEKRVVESKNRPGATRSYEDTMQEVADFIATAEKNDTSAGYFYPEEEVKRTASLVKEWEEWIQSKVEAQSKVKPTDEPVLTVADLEERVQRMKLDLMLLKSRRRYVVKETPTPTPTPTPAPTPEPDTEKTKTEEEPKEGSKEAPKENVKEDPKEEPKAEQEPKDAVKGDKEEPVKEGTTTAETKKPVHDEL